MQKTRVAVEIINCSTVATLILLISINGALNFTSEGKKKKQRKKKGGKKRRGEKEKEKSHSQKITRNYVQDCTKLLSLRRHCKGIFISEKRCTCFLEARINELNKEISRNGEGVVKKNRELWCV